MSSGREIFLLGDEDNSNNNINNNGYKVLGRRCSRIRMACRRFWNQI